MVKDHTFTVFHIDDGRKLYGGKKTSIWKKEATFGKLLTTARRQS